MQPPRKRSKAAGFTLEEKYMSASGCLIERLTKCMWTPTFTLPVHHHRLIHLIKKGYIRVPVRINRGDEQWRSCISACGRADSRLWPSVMFTSCPAGRCVCEPAAGNAWTRAPASWPAGRDRAPYPAAAWPEAPTSGRTSGWTCGRRESPASGVQE